MRRARLLVALAAFSCADPVHDNQVEALGPESGAPGPLHRAGQPCLTCHGGSGPSRAAFAFGGTVYKEDSNDGFEGVDVQLTDANQVVRHSTTNRAGNFYIPHEAWEPIFPVHVQISFKDASAQMGAHIGRDGSCAACHFEPRGPASAGHVVLATGDGSGGGP